MSANTAKIVWSDELTRRFVNEINNHRPFVKKKGETKTESWNKVIAGIQPILAKQSKTTLSYTGAKDHWARIVKNLLRDFSLKYENVTIEELQAIHVKDNSLEQIIINLVELQKAEDLKGEEKKKEKEESNESSHLLQSQGTHALKQAGGDDIDKAKASHPSSERISSSSHNPMIDIYDDWNEQGWNNEPVDEQFHVEESVGEDAPKDDDEEKNKKNEKKRRKTAKKEEHSFEDRLALALTGSPDEQEKKKVKMDLEIQQLQRNQEIQEQQMKLDREKFEWQKEREKKELELEDRRLRIREMELQQGKEQK